MSQYLVCTHIYEYDEVLIVTFKNFHTKVVKSFVNYSHFLKYAFLIWSNVSTCQSFSFFCFWHFLITLLCKQRKNCQHLKLYILICCLGWVQCYYHHKSIKHKFFYTIRDRLVCRRLWCFVCFFIILYYYYYILFIFYFYLMLLLVVGNLFV